MVAQAFPNTQDGEDIQEVSSDENIRKIRRAIAMGYKDTPGAKGYRKRFNAAKQIRAPFESDWRLIKENIAPFFGKWLGGTSSQVNEYEEQLDYSFITDSTPLHAVQTAADGLHGAVTASDRQWFNFYLGSYSREGENISPESKQWITNVQDAVRDALSRSNFYTVIYLLYEELLVCGNGLMTIDADEENIVRFTVHTAGTYWFVTNNTGSIDQVFIRHCMQAKDIAEKYGFDESPDIVKQCLRTGSETRVFPVMECIQPWNYMGDSSPSNEIGYTYESVIFLETGGDGDSIITKEPFRTKPFVAATWADPGNGTYSRTSPGHDTLPDVMQLHKVVTDINDAVAWQVNPAFIAPDSLFREHRNIHPGDIITTEGDPKASLNPVMTPSFDINGAFALRDSLQDSVNKGFYVDKFLLVANRTRQITAAEVYALEGERDAILNPIISRIGDNVLYYALVRTYDIIAYEWNILDEPPEDIAGMQLFPYFTGDVAESQRSRRTTSRISATLNLIAQAAQLDPLVLQYYDIYKLLKYADEGGVTVEGVLKNENEAEQIQQAAMEQQQQAAQAQQMQGALQAANVAGNTPVGDDNLLGQLLEE